MGISKGQPFTVYVFCVHWKSALEPFAPESRGANAFYIESALWNCSHPKGESKSCDFSCSTFSLRSLLPNCKRNSWLYCQLGARSCGRTLNHLYVFCTAKQNLIQSVMEARYRFLCFENRKPVVQGYTAGANSGLVPSVV